MSQNDRYTEADWARTLIGFGHHGEPRRESGGLRTPGLTRLGGRARGLGQVFEVDGAPLGLGALVVKQFPWAAGLPEGVVRDFTRDALMVAKLRHPHVVQVVDAGRLPDGTPFVVQERLAARTLEEATRGGLVAAADLMPILRGIAGALAAAHATGVAHGELRADNVLLANVAGYERGFAKLTDFGVARLAAAARAFGADPDEPPAGLMPPEQRRDPAQRADQHTDQYALAALVYRLLAGTSGAAPQAAPSVLAIVARATSWNPENRFDSVASFFQALEQAIFAGAESPKIPTAAVEPPPPTLPAPAPGSLTQQFFAEGDRHEAAQAAGDGAADVDDALATSGILQIPRRRAPVIVAASLALASMAVIGVTAVSLSRAPAVPVPRASSAVIVAGPKLPPIEPPPPLASVTVVPPRHTPPAKKPAARALRSPTQPPPIATAAQPAGAEPAAPPPPVTAPSPSPPAESPPPAAATAPEPPANDDITQPSEEAHGEPIEEATPPAPPAGAGM